MLTLFSFCVACKSLRLVIRTTNGDNCVFVFVCMCVVFFFSFHFISFLLILIFSFYYRYESHIQNPHLYWYNNVEEMRNAFKYFPITHKNVDWEMRSRNCVFYLMLFQRNLFEIIQERKIHTHTRTHWKTTSTQWMQCSAWNEYNSFCMAGFFHSKPQNKNNNNKR